MQSGATIARYQLKSKRDATLPFQAILMSHFRKAITFAILFTTTLALSVAGIAPARAGDPLYPDIVEQISHIQIQNEHKREMLRFSTIHINVGDGPLQIRGGGQVASCTIDGVSYPQCTIATQEILDSSGNIVQTNPAGTALFHPQHNHWHQNAVVNYELRPGSLEGKAIATGQKVTFCMVDNDKTDLIQKHNKRTYFECNSELQGISVGWSDSYHQSTQGQELDITGAPEGVYYLTHYADPDNHWLETNENNNFAWVKLLLSRQGANPKMTILDRSPCSGAACGSPSNP